MTVTTYNYFAFGSNMCSSTMTALRSIEPIASSAAILPQHILRFNIPGVDAIEPSSASVEPCISLYENASLTNVSQNVHGVLYKLTEEDFLKMCNTEGVPFAYSLHRVRVVPYIGDGEQKGLDALREQCIFDDDNKMKLKRSIFAYTLRATRKEWRIGTDIPPSQAYLNVLIRGAKEFSLDREYLEYLESIETGKTIGNGLAEMMLDVAMFRKSFDRQ